MEVLDKLMLMLAAVEKPRSDHQLGGGVNLMLVSVERQVFSGGGQSRPGVFAVALILFVIECNNIGAAALAGAFTSILRVNSSSSLIEGNF